VHGLEDQLENLRQITTDVVVARLVQLVDAFKNKDSQCVISHIGLSSQVNKWYRPLQRYALADGRFR